MPGTRPAAASACREKLTPPSSKSASSCEPASSEMPTLLRSTVKLPGCPTTTVTASPGSAARSSLVTRIGTGYRPSGTSAATVTVSATVPTPVAGSTRNRPCAGTTVMPAGGVTVNASPGSREPSRNALTVT
jgi:hypothetical protein